MYKEEITHYSNCLSRDMHICIYGHGGVPFLAFPTQDSKCHNYEEFGMINELSDYLEDGKIQYFVVDTIDKESWSEGDWDLGRRAWKQELYFHYIVDEVMPIILERTGGKLPMTTGCSLGANHAVITMLRRPDLFSGCLALSGVYDSNVFFKGWMNETLYIICVGQGAWEEDGVRSLRYLESVFREKGIGAWCDFWGYDVNHDWPWWFKQMRYFIPIILERWGMQ